MCDLKLPCNVGDTIYFLEKCTSFDAPGIFNFKAAAIRIDIYTDDFGKIVKHGEVQLRDAFCSFWENFNQFGKTLFTDYDEAKAALDKVKEERKKEEMASREREWI